MSIRVMSMVYAAHFWDVSYLHKGKKKSGEQYEKTIKVSNFNIKSVCLALADHANDEGEGAYPSVETISIKTELSEVTVVACLRAMRQEGIITYTGRSKWSTCNYTISKPKLEEMASWERQKREKPKTKAALVSKVKPLQPKTKAALPKPSLRPKPSGEEEEPTEQKNIYTIYEQEIGLLTPSIADALKDWEKDLPEKWIKDAILEASANGARRWSYVNAILKRWQAQKSQEPTHKPSKPQKTKGGETPLDRYAREKGYA